MSTPVCQRRPTTSSPSVRLPRPLLPAPFSLPLPAPGPRFGCAPELARCSAKDGASRVHHRWRVSLALPCAALTVLPLRSVLWLTILSLSSCSPPCLLAVTSAERFSKKRPTFQESMEVSWGRCAALPWASSATRVTKRARLPLRCLPREWSRLSGVVGALLCTPYCGNRIRGVCHRQPLHGGSSCYDRRLTGEGALSTSLPCPVSARLR